MEAYKQRKKQALQIIGEATGLLRLTRQEHEVIQRALVTLEEEMPVNLRPLREEEKREKTP